MIEQLKKYDEQALLLLNQFHYDWLDPIMLLITRTEFWIPLYIVLIYLIFKNYGTAGWKVLAAASLVVTMTSVITGAVMKPYFQRLRPSQEQSLKGIVHLVDDYNGGIYGFASGHAATTLGVALFCFLILRKFYRRIDLIFIWALLMTYTRIYLGVHYPGDILAGAMIGILSGFAGYRFFLLIVKKKESELSFN